jgi:hypothetical protein
MRLRAQPDHQADAVAIRKLQVDQYCRVFFRLRPRGRRCNGVGEIHGEPCLPQLFPYDEGYVAVVFA